MTTHQMIQAELAAAGLVMGDLTKSGWFHTLSNGRRMWVQAAPRQDKIIVDPIAEELAEQGMRRASEDESGWYVLTSVGKIWATDEPLDDLFGANQSSLLMTVLCPTCCGSTHTIFTRYGDYRVCDADRTHERVRV